MSEPVDGPVQNGVEMGPGHGSGHGLPPLTQSLSQSSSQSSSHNTHPGQAHHPSHLRDTEESAASHPMNIDSDSTEGPSPNFGLASANSSSAHDIKPEDINANAAANQSSHHAASSHDNISASLNPSFHSLEGLHNSNLAKRQGLASGPMVPSSTGALNHLDRPSGSQPAFNLLNSSILKQQLGVSPFSILPPIQNPPTLLSTMSTLDTAAVPSTHPNTAYSQSSMQLTSPVTPLIPPNLSSSNPAMPILQPLQGMHAQPNGGITPINLAPNAHTNTTQSSQPTTEFADMKHPYQVEPINTTSVGISTIGNGHEAIPVIISTTTTTITTTTITPIDPSQVPSAMALASAGVVPNGQTLPFIPSGTAPGSLPFPIVPNLHQMQSQAQSPTSASRFNFSEGAVAAIKNIKSSSSSSISGPAGADVGTQKKELDALGEAT